MTYLKHISSLRWRLSPTRFDCFHNVRIRVRFPSKQNNEKRFSVPNSFHPKIKKKEKKDKLSKASVSDQIIEHSKLSRKSTTQTQRMPASDYERPRSLQNMWGTRLFLDLICESEFELKINISSVQLASENNGLGIRAKRPHTCLSEVSPCTNLLRNLP